MNSPPPLLPAEPVFRPDGTLHSPQYEDVYASADGALAEAGHVFLRGNGLPERWRGRNTFVVVETGFGAGLNFLATWAEWRAHATPGARLHYISVEKHPFRRDALLRMQSAWPELATLACALSVRYPPLVPGFHRLLLGDGVTLTLLLGDVLPMLRQLEARADAFYLDGFAPARNPEMWSDAVLRELGRLAAPGATAATYSVAGSVRAGLTAAGFRIERCAGFGSKREMLTARYAGDERAPASAVRTAAVVGAGLAGTACAAHLAARGWDVQVIERHAGPAREASGNAAGLLMPAFSLDWNPPTRLTVPGFLYAAQWLDSLATSATAPVWARTGVLQLARDRTHFERQRRILQTFALPDDLIRLVSADEGSALAGAAVAGPGWWLPSAGWADPVSVCLAQLAVHGARVGCRFAHEAIELRRAGDEWQVLDRSGAMIAQAAVVVLANAYAAAQLQGCDWMPLGRARGQVSSLPAVPGRPLRASVCCEGFITPAAGGLHCIGASYDAGSETIETSVEDHVGNLERLEHLLPGFAGAVDSAALEGRAAFRTVSPDRMPLAGRLRLDHEQESDGLFACLGLASRGLTWAPVLGETIACLAGGEPLPLERDVMRWLDPARFSQRAR